MNAFVNATRDDEMTKRHGAFTCPKRGTIQRYIQLGNQLQFDIYLYIYSQESISSQNILAPVGIIVKNSSQVRYNYISGCLAVHSFLYFSLCLFLTLLHTHTHTLIFLFVLLFILFILQPLSFTYSTSYSYSYLSYLSHYLLLSLSQSPAISFNNFQSTPR